MQKRLFLVDKAKYRVWETRRRPDAKNISAMKMKFGCDTVALYWRKFKVYLFSFISLKKLEIPAYFWRIAVD